MPKYVVSSTLAEASRENTTILRAAKTVGAGVLVLTYERA